MVKHNMHKSKIYNTWRNIKARCYYKGGKRYKNYGGRGICVCDEWIGDKGFINFYTWAMCNGYQDNLTIDRVNNDGNYEPQNCRWITNKEQQSNRSNNRLISYSGETKTLTQWAETLGMCKKTLSKRLDKWGTERALTEPLHLEFKR